MAVTSVLLSSVGGLTLHVGGEPVPDYHGPRRTDARVVPQLVEERRADHVVGGAQYHGAAAAHDFMLHAAIRW